MNAPKNRQSDDRNSHIASLALATPVWVACGSCAASSCPCPPGPARAVAGVCSIGGHQLLLRPGLEAPGVHAEQQQQEARDRATRICEHRGVAEARQAEREHQRVVRRRRQVDAVAVAVVVGLGGRGDTSPASATADVGRGRRRGGGATVAGVVTVVAGAAGRAASPGALRRPRCTCGATSRRGPRPPGSRRSCTRAAATGSTTRATGRPTGRPERFGPRLAV